LLVLVGVLVVVGVVVAVSALGGDDDGHEKGDPFPENKNFHASADASPFAGPAPLTSNLKADAFRESGDVTYFWRFDDGTTSRDQNPVHTFKQPGYYTVLMDARDSKGNRDRFTLIMGAWPASLWNTAQRRRLTRQETLAAVRAQGKRTQARRQALKKQGKAQNEL
jgi:PKD domain